MKYTLVTLPLVMLLLSACGSETPTPAPVKKATTQTVERKAPPPPPKKTHKPKEVKDTNYETAYMYPEDNKKKKEKVTTTESTSAAMTKDECVAMITQEKFDKYTAMFGSEEASIKRCQMIKAMNS
jgi:hypothetical protein